MNLTQTALSYRRRKKNCNSVLASFTTINAKRSSFQKLRLVCFPVHNFTILILLLGYSVAVLFLCMLLVMFLAFFAF